ncbi:MAG TPA: hypothetical protein VIA62_01500 [Thermoanaerobaculia bacterium]|nr:hypothetical protein [Thermoanaerobaculia bacterium]
MASKHTPPPLTGGGDNQQDRNSLLQTHLAEYQAITTRNTYWLTLQYSLFPILGAAIAVLAQMWNQFDKNPALSTQAHRIIIWLAVAIINVIIIAHTEVGWESYNNVVYLENCLRPRIVYLLRDIDEERKSAALGYETYLKRQRGGGPKWWEVPVPIVSAALLVGGIILFGLLYPWTPVEWVAVPINTGLLALVTKVTLKMIRRRGDIGKPGSVIEC